MKAVLVELDRECAGCRMFASVVRHTHTELCRILGLKWWDTTPLGLRAEVRRLKGGETVLRDRDAELIELKGPCSNKQCTLHYAHRGPCNEKQLKEREHMPLTSANTLIKRLRNSTCGTAGRLSQAISGVLGLFRTPKVNNRKAV